MNISALNRVAENAIDHTEANLIFVLYNQQKGLEVLPWWEASEDEIENAPAKLATMLIRFADDAGAGPSIGTFAYRMDEDQPQGE